MQGDCIERMRMMPRNSIDAIATDPPYKVTGKAWDTGIAFRADTWRVGLEVARPGAHLAATGHHTTWHRMATAIEDAGWEYRATMAWIRGSAIPKSPTQLRPLHDPIIIARKPFSGSERALIADTGLGGLNAKDPDTGRHKGTVIMSHGPLCIPSGVVKVHGDQRAEHLADPSNRGQRGGGFAEPGANSGDPVPNGPVYGDRLVTVWDCQPGCPVDALDIDRRVSFPAFCYENKIQALERDAGCWDLAQQDRDVYGAGFSSDTKLATERQRRAVDALVADGLDRELAIRQILEPVRNRAYNTHPTVKPLAVCRWILDLIVPGPGATVLDPFAGTCSFGVAAGLDVEWVGIEMDSRWIEVGKRRLGYWLGIDEQGRAVSRQFRPSRAGKAQMTLGDMLKPV